MSRFLFVLAAAAAVVAGATTAGAHRSATSSCALTKGAVKHVIYLQFDNTHFRRDAANVPSDLEQMPHLLNFLKGNGTLFTNDHTILISHTAGGILTSLTGLYPDRKGQTVSNSYAYYANDGTTQFSSSFKYWTDEVDATLDPKPNMTGANGKTTPAPWVPYTRAGCDFGGVGTANIELENTATNATGDMTRVFGTGSPEWNEANTPATRAKAQTDFVGIAIHCATGGGACATSTNARPDALPDEPGGYNGFSALYGAKYVNPAIAGGNACVPDTAGAPITDPQGNCGFPGFDGMLAKNTLGYVAQMQENGVPVTYGYISDAHDFHVPNTTTDAFASSAQGPGESGFRAQLKAYDDAFDAFFRNLAAHGINRSNTLFVVTVDEGDHFAGGAGVPQTDGSMAYAHTNCSDLTKCPSNQIGEVNANLAALLPAGEPSFVVHSDDAPTVYVKGNPAPTDATVRRLERDAAALRGIDPYRSGNPVPLTEALADPVEEAALHMVNADPARTPTFTLFGNPDFFFTTSNPSCGANPCVSPGFAWNHGDVQDDIANTWVGIVGPGVLRKGQDAKTWTDHTNVRPTILALTHLKDDYVHDGRVLVEALTKAATPRNLTSTTTRQLGAIYEQLNAPFGQFSAYTLAASTKALASGSASDDSTYTRIEDQLRSLTAQRRALASTIRAQLNKAAFRGKRLNVKQVKAEVTAAKKLIAAAKALSAS
ncbi:MAG: hypothetical protein QOF43_1285 [Gaiellaceae bacterium]|nr:hypothetical protein [Gaiellaceae bacterium]